MLDESEMIGKKFNMLTVIERVEDQIIKSTGQHCAMYRCRCDCGNYKTVRESNLVHNGVKSCGCIRSKSKREAGARYAKELIGNRYGKLTVIEWMGAERGQSRYLCKCDCGNETTVWRSCLLAGHTISCGCYSRERAAETVVITGHNNGADLMGRTFGRLTVIDKIGSVNQNVIWKCRCSCGTICEYPSARLLSGVTRSCGCLISRGEEEIGVFLTSHGVCYEKQKSFPDCRDIKPLPFDFWIESKNTLIEFDGEQHFKDSAFFHHTLAYVQKHDEIKNNYCKKNGIRLIRIPYTDINRIDDYQKEVV